MAEGQNAPQSTASSRAFCSCCVPDGTTATYDAGSSRNADVAIFVSYGRLLSGQARGPVFSADECESIARAVEIATCSVPEALEIVLGDCLARALFGNTSNAGILGPSTLEWWAAQLDRFNAWDCGSSHGDGRQRLVAFASHLQKMSPACRERAVLIALVQTLCISCRLQVSLFEHYNTLPDPIADARTGVAMRVDVALFANSHEQVTTTDGGFHVQVLRICPCPRRRMAALALAHLYRCDVGAANPLLWLQPISARTTPSAVRLRILFAHLQDLSQAAALLPASVLMPPPQQPPAVMAGDLMREKEKSRMLAAALDAATRRADLLAAALSKMQEEGGGSGTEKHAEAEFAGSLDGTHQQNAGPEQAHRQDLIKYFDALFSDFDAATRACGADSRVNIVVSVTAKDVREALAAGKGASVMNLVLALAQEMDTYVCSPMRLSSPEMRAALCRLCSETARFWDRSKKAGGQPNREMNRAARTLRALAREVRNLS